LLHCGGGGGGNTFSRNKNFHENKGVFERIMRRYGNVGEGRMMEVVRRRKWM